NSSTLTGLVGGTYTVTEDGQPNWTNTLIVPSNGTGLVTPGGTPEVKFNNVGTGNLKITKNTTGGDGTFTFHVTGPNYGPTTVTLAVTGNPGTNSSTLTGLVGGTYTVTEDGQPNWQNTLIVPSNGTGLVTPGGTPEVKFNNVGTGNLKITKNTTGGDGTFTFHVTGPNYGPTTVTLAVTGNPGTNSSTLTGLIGG